MAKEPHVFCHMAVLVLMGVDSMSHAERKAEEQRTGVIKLNPATKLTSPTNSVNISSSSSFSRPVLVEALLRFLSTI
jgi:hypothetical protein